MFCQKPLGTNEVVESFPVGRRLAFDAARGRLWVVCTKCERWNLTPLEERWEAVEDCERLFRDTRIRVSTDHIGLARHPEGLTLVRIGKPQRPEFAAWRYGDQFGRRRRRAILYGAAGIAVVGGIVVGGTAAGLSAGVISQIPNWFNLWNSRRTLVKLHPADGGVVKLNQQDLLGTRVRPSDDEQGFRLQVRKKKTKTWYEGTEARRFAGAILPRMNRTGGSTPSAISSASRRDSASRTRRVFRATSTRCPGRTSSPSKWRFTKSRSDAPWKANSGFWRRPGRRPKRSRTSRTSCSFPRERRSSCGRVGRVRAGPRAGSVNTGRMSRTDRSAGRRERPGRTFLSHSGNPASAQPARQPTPAAHSSRALAYAL